MPVIHAGKIKLAERNLQLEQQRETLEILTAEHEDVQMETKLQEIAKDALNINNNGITYQVRLSSCLYIYHHLQYLSAMRFRECLSLFLQYAITPHVPTRSNDAKDTQRSKQLMLSGCSSIMNIPLPNSGNYEGSISHHGS